MQCAACGAANPDSAAWCGQCFAPFGNAAPEPEEAPPSLTEDADERDPAPARVVTEGIFRAEGDRIEWTCTICGEINPLDHYTCQVCGTPLSAAEARERDVDWRAARFRELLFPGLGHVAAGDAGNGWARTIIALLWLFGLVVVLLTGVEGLVASVPLVIGLAVLWLAGPHDLRALEAGRTPLLDTRRFLWLVVAVTAGLMLTGLAAALL